jgi:hypothetical protein
MTKANRQLLPGAGALNRVAAPIHRSIIATLLLALLGLVCCSRGVAQPAAIDPPLAGRPPQFSNIVGRYTIAATAVPSEAAVEEPIVLRVTISGTGPAKYQPQRKYLKLFPERWANEFYVEPVPADDRARPEQNSWEFVWRLRAKHQQVKAIDGIKLVTYEPAPRKFQTDYAEAIPIKVTAARPAPPLPDNVPVRVLPASFYELPKSDAILAQPAAATAWPGWLIVTLLVAPPVLTLVGVRYWQRRFPPAGQQWRQQCSQAARRALYALRAGNDEPAWVVIGRFLRERLDFPGVEPTPVEVQRFLRRRGASRPMAEKVAAYFHGCDKARFAAADHDGAIASRDEAGRLIQALEEDLCAP